MTTEAPLIDHFSKSEVVNRHKQTESVDGAIEIQQRNYVLMRWQKTHDGRCSKGVNARKQLCSTVKIIIPSFSMEAMSTRPASCIFNSFTAHVLEHVFNEKTSLYLTEQYVPLIKMAQIDACVASSRT